MTSWPTSPVRVLREGGYEADTSMIYYGLPARWAPPIEEKIIARVHELVQATPPAPTGPATPALGPRTPREEQATFSLPKGLRIELVAHEPQVVDPVALVFDEN